MSLIFAQLGYFAVAGAALGVGLMSLFGVGVSIHDMRRYDGPEPALGAAVLMLLAGGFLAAASWVIAYAISLT